MNPAALRRVAKLQRGAGFPPEQQGVSEGDLPFFKVGDFSDYANTRYLRTCNNWVSHKTALSLRAVPVPSGSVLLPKIGAALLGNARRIATVPTVFDNNVLAVVPTERVDSRYLYYWLCTVDLAKLANPGPIPSLDDSALLSQLVPCNEVARQRAIADYLDAETARIDALIEKKRRMAIVMAERYKAERAHRVLRSLNPVTGMGNLPAGWRESPLGVLIALHRGFDLPSDAREDGAVPIISSGGISGFHSVPGCQGPGVVTGRYGTIGEVFYSTGPYWPLNTTLFVSEFRGNDPRWIYHLLAVMPLDFDADKSAVTGINRNVIGALRTPVPSLEEQRHIAGQLDARSEQTERVLTPLSGQIALLNERRQALITAAVTGELNLPGVAA